MVIFCVKPPFLAPSGTMHMFTLRNETPSRHRIRYPYANSTSHVFGPELHGNANLSLTRKWSLNSIINPSAQEPEPQVLFTQLVVFENKAPNIDLHTKPDLVASHPCVALILGNPHMLSKRPMTCLHGAPMKRLP